MRPTPAVCGVAARDCCDLGHVGLRVWISRGEIRQCQDGPVERSRLDPPGLSLPRHVEIRHVQVHAVIHAEADDPVTLEARSR